MRLIAAYRGGVRSELEAVVGEIYVNAGSDDDRMGELVLLVHQFVRISSSALTLAETGSATLDAAAIMRILDSLVEDDASHEDAAE